MRISWIPFRGAKRLPNGTVTSEAASVRYRVLEPIRRMDPTHHHQIIPINEQTPPDRGDAALDADVIVFSKSFVTSNEELARRAKAAGVRVIVDLCDNHFEHPELGAHYRAMTGLADQVICNTPDMARIAQSFAGSPVVVISDPYEGERKPPRFAPGERLRLLWFGHLLNIDSLEAAFDDLAAYAARQPLSLTILTQMTGDFERFVTPFAERAKGRLDAEVKPWSLEGQAAELEACDAVIIPSLQQQTKVVKSANRMVQAIWAGRPVAAQPMPAYAPFADWTPIRPLLSDALDTLLQDAPQVEARLAQAQDYIATTYDPAAIGRQWEEVLKTEPRPRPVKLNLGCGDKILEGFINVDVVEARAGKKPDVICDLHQLTPFEDNSADEIMAIHVVEHFWRWEIVDILKEWTRVLKPGGRMVLECPNLLSACQAVLDDPANATLPGQQGQRSMWVLYGDPTWRDPLMVHRWGYTPQSLAQVMHEAGLRDLRQEPAQYKLREPRDMRVTGRKPSE